MSERTPVAGAVLTITGGVFIVLGGLVEAALGVFIATVFPRFGALLIVGGLSVGTLTILMGLLMVALPALKSAWGVITIVLAVLSLAFSFFGGFLIGFILALIGGILAITYRPPPPPVVLFPPMGYGFPPPPPPPDR